MPRGTRRADMHARLTPRRLSWLGWFWGRVWFATKIALGVALVCGVLVWALAQGYVRETGRWAHDKFVDAAAGAGLRVSKVSVKGLRNLDEETLRDTLRLAEGAPLLGVDMQVVHARLMANPWIRDAQVRRIWPDKIIITLTERQPLAIWMDAPGGAAIIDAEGVVLSREGLGDHGKLLAVSGPGAEKAAGALIALLKGQPEIAVRVARATWVSERRWDLGMDDGAVLRLPEDDPGYALARAAKAQEQDKVLDQGLKSIDLRQKDRIILESKPGDKRDLLLKGGNSV